MSDLATAARLRQASSQLPASWYEQAEAAGQIITVLGQPVMPATVLQGGAHA